MANIQHQHRYMYLLASIRLSSLDRVLRISMLNCQSVVTFSCLFHEVKINRDIFMQHYTNVLKLQWLRGFPGTPTQAIYTILIQF